MLLYRLTHAKFAGDLSGLGAKKYGGRWNPKGIPMVYCCETISLCALETAAHSDGISELKNLFITCFELSSKTKIKRLQASQLPSNWQQIPSPEACKKVGADWANKSVSPILGLPSAIVPRESIYLINPNFPHLSELVSVLWTEPFTLDPRINLK